MRTSLSQALRNVYVCASEKPRKPESLGLENPGISPAGFNPLPGNVTVCCSSQVPFHAGKKPSEGLCRPIIGQRGLGQACGASCPGLTRSETVYLACSLIGPKKKPFVLTDWPSERKSELVLFEHRTRLASLLQEEIICVEKLVTQKLKNRSVKIVIARFCDQADLGTSVAAKPGIV